MMIYHLSRCNLIYTELWEGENFLTVSFWSHRQLISIYIYSTGPHLRIWFRKKVMISNLSKFQGNCAIIMLTIIPQVTHHILLAPQSLNLSTNHGVNKVGVFSFFFLALSGHSLVVLLLVYVLFDCLFSPGESRETAIFCTPTGFCLWVRLRHD